LTDTKPNAALDSSYPRIVKSNHGRIASEIPNSIPRGLGGTAERSLSLGWSAVGVFGLEHRGGLKSPRRGSHGLSSNRRSPSSIPSLDASDDESILACHSQRKQGAAESKNEFDVPVTPHPSRSSNTPGTIAEPLSSTSEDLKNVAADPDCLDPPEVDAQGREEEGSKEPGLSFEDLVDRLLSQPISMSDAKFAIIFLCLYRKFAAPSTLILAIIRRFEELNDKEILSLTRMASQLRYLNILKDWVSHYPGDFAHPLSRRTMIGFVQSLSSSQEYAIASKEISPHLEVVSEDDDTEWACSDNTRSRANTMESFLTMSSIQSTASTLNAASPTLTADSSTEDVVNHANTEKAPTSQRNRISATLSSTSSISRSDSQSTSSFQTLLNTVENAQRQAQLLTPISRNMLTKVQWHQLMEIPEEQIARELTRIDWIMYSSIKPRDLIRHVSLQTDQKDKCKSLEHVNRMIHQFNHVAFWVTNMILLRDKPKHRAKALEKFMGVAWKLRYLNNYNSLGAVIAGINGTAVHRLSQTRELIPAEAQKQFMRLEILMGTQKSHFAYRLAFGNTSSSRIPFLPLHRRDLVLAEQGNRTYCDSGEGDRINWKKFEIMGEVIVSIRKSQEVGYPTISRNEEVQRLLLDGRFCKDDDVSLRFLVFHAWVIVYHVIPRTLSFPLLLSTIGELFIFVNGKTNTRPLGTLRPKSTDRSARRWGKY